MYLSLVPYLGLAYSGFATAATINLTTPSLGFPQSMEQSWAQYSPYFPVDTYQAPPDGCSVTQVNLLQRHGARYPTSSDGKSIKKSVKQLQGASNFSSPLEFVKNFTYDLGKSDLVPYGAAQSYDAGQLHYARYSGLISGSELPFVRASDSERVVMSALNWTAGFAAASDKQFSPVLSVIISESGNDTLDDNMCTNAGNSDNQTAAWLSVFAPSIADRLNTDAPGADLSLDDIANLMSLCPFETVANEAPSPFCNIFTTDEWASYEYYGDVGDYYGTGYGQELGPVQGVGYVNELIARLTDEPVQDETQTNSTLDSSPITFPLNRTFYADFTHDTEMIAIYSAIGLFNQTSPLDLSQPNPNRTWILSQMVPFSARMITEKLQCNTNGETGNYIRILVNDAVQSLGFCGDTGNGLCEVDAFVESQQFATSNGDGEWENCFS
ncbi:hypothetical protein SERLA73DRAFT_170869 [Serpula lacrymans var. lacrymans S7.3]|uniref:Phytase A n=2 Tax=Serpula lacrymans var. lacrymans TaxID=341189 RepID=F8Q8Q5_SERL3|nr:uncharacterized protein SERLADRAFT_441797 [Serpula lacrymans var. lacrymans S7.9]EGN94960.1 hypothetical protein SERLA73DRAFT_170869 [Serpula lacrymans var. lacrymans S7.3]EGO20450.1 hypothetical protein SERLADRAFT_441797 [Serpula lacrymans var. lacrymans S7.9]